MSVWSRPEEVDLVIVVMVMTSKRNSMVVVVLLLPKLVPQPRTAAVRRCVGTHGCTQDEVEHTFRRRGMCSARISCDYKHVVSNAGCDGPRCEHTGTGKSGTRFCRAASLSVSSRLWSETWRRLA